MVEKDTNKSSLLARWKSKKKEGDLKNTINKAPKGINIPLSYGQKRLWFLQQMHPKSPFYNYSEAYTFDGDLNQNLLIKCLKQIYLDHDILRTTYHIENDTIFQKTNKDEVLEITLHDLTNSTDEAQNIIEAEAKRYFDLTEGPLVRCVLIKTSQTHHVLQVTMHHIITDEWSLKLFREQLSKYYQTLTLKSDLSANKTKIQYTDYAYWEQKQELNQKHLNYWKHQLSGEIPTLNLPTDFSRPLQTNFKGTISYKDNYSIELSQKLLALANTLDTTPYVLMLSVYYVFLHRCSGQSDILIGTPITSRDNKSLEDVLGFFLDTIVLRTQIKPTLTFKNLVALVRQNTLEAFENKNTPFGVLVKDLNVKRTASSNPFFQVMFVYNEKLKIPEFSEGLKLSHKLLDPKVSKFDLTLFISEKNDSLSATFEYSTELFKESTIERFQNYFKLLLEGVVANPNETISTLPMLTNYEKQLFFKTKTDRVNNFKSFNGINNVIENISITNPDAIAVSFKNESLTYIALNDKANTLATHLLSHIKKPNEIIGLGIDRSVNMIVGILAILKAGCAYLPIDLEYPKDRINFMLKDAEVKTVITQQSASAIFEDTPINKLYIDTLDLSSITKPQDLPVSNLSNIAYVIYTSGSSGQPKGVPITHSSILHSTSARLDFYDNNPTAFLLMSSMSFDSSKAGIFWTLCTGGNVVITEKRVEQDIEKIAHIIHKKHISHTLMLPSLYKLLLEYIDTKKLQSLNTVIVAGEACYPSLCAEHFDKLSNVKLYNEYGPTEASVWCIAYKIDENDINNTSIPIGKPIANAQIYLLDESLKHVPMGTAGEIYIGGKGLTNGYLNRPKLNRKAFITNPFIPSEKLYKTGDLGKYTNDENIAFLGRSDQQIKIRGYRIELNEIEKVITSYDDEVEETFVIIEDDTFNTSINDAIETNSTDKLLNTLKQLDDNEIETIIASIKALNTNQKEYLLNQLEV